MNKKVAVYLIPFLGFISSYKSHAQNTYKTTLFGKVALKNSSIPVRPGISGERPFWNKYAKRFIYAPAFNYKEIIGAKKYRYEISCIGDSSSFTFGENVPLGPLSPVWDKMPIGYFNLRVVGVSDEGDSVGLSGKGQYYHAAFFNGPYHNALMPYDSSGMVALFHILHKSYVTYWLNNNEPDPGYKLYRYPAKIFSAVISAAVTYAKLNPHAKESERAIRIAKIVGDYLLKISIPAGNAWEYFPPTYYGESIKKLNQAPWIRLENLIPHFGADAGNSYLDLYDLTKDEKYLLAAKRIAHTFLKTQIKNGAWYLYVNPYSGKPTTSTDNICIPTTILKYLDRLQNDYKMKGLEVAINKAFNWIMNNPVKTFNWQAQFEDVGTHKPYEDLNRKEACQFAIYLLKQDKNKKQYIRLAEELLRYSEDQFVIWEKPRPDINKGSSNPAFISKNWITPCTLEQYAYMMPTNLAAMRMMKVYWYAYLATHKKIYLAKAKSFANTMTIVQQAHEGNYSTYFTKYNLEEWLNCNVYAAKEMIRFGLELKNLK